LHIIYSFLAVVPDSETILTVKINLPISPHVTFSVSGKMGPTLTRRQALQAFRSFHFFWPLCENKTPISSSCRGKRFKTCSA